MQLASCSCVAAVPMRPTCAVLRQSTVLGSFYREVRGMRDGGCIALDWWRGSEVPSSHEKSAPVVLILHGITGAPPPTSDARHTQSYSRSITSLTVPIRTPASPEASSPARLAADASASHSGPRMHRRPVRQCRSDLSGSARFCCNDDSMPALLRFPPSQLL